MISPEVFHHQLINSVVMKLATTPYEQFVVRSELISRTREFQNTMSPKDNATASIFFNGDYKAYEEQLQSATNDSITHHYDVTLMGMGRVAILEIDL